MGNPYTCYSESGAEYFVRRSETAYSRYVYYSVVVCHKKNAGASCVNEVRYESAEAAQSALDEMARENGWRKRI
ncbi:hypothetical protein [Cloacibacillus sp. An23]|uniref:hypothetical protein n=1 Tax=Cloacibacillus sp. An23 TaxID=1965591 RepID=UPI000B396613|nr:hypothetical protein [Cloacibacillus sp. An23]OUO91846.1 hypothetical protein B5F39_11980 [Cloacibacillus sp. An23]